MDNVITSQKNKISGKPDGNAKISIEGEINLGSQLELIQENAAVNNTSFRFSSGMPALGGLSKVDLQSMVTDPSSLQNDKLDWKLRPTGSPIQVVGKGLTESYMIFGGPGSGKTYLLMYLLKQIFAINSNDPDAKVGALILDPKAALIEEVEEMLSLSGRFDDLIVLNSETLAASNQAINIIDVGVDGTELGTMLVLAAQAAGTGASEEYWFGAWKTLFEAAVPLLIWQDERVLTLESLMSAVLEIDSSDKDGRSIRRIERIATEARSALKDIPDEFNRRDMRVVIDQVEAFYRQEADNIATIETLMRQAYGGFLRSKWRSFSYAAPNITNLKRTTFYDRIIDEGKIVLVSISPSDPMMAKIICTLVKVLFQRTILGRLDRVRAGTLKNFKRLVVMAVDEYSAVASEIQGQPMGDGLFFSQCRQNGAMGIVATQSVNLLQSSSLKDNWKAITSVCAAKIFMRLADNETTEEATKLAGEYDWSLTSRGTSSQKDGAGSSTNTELRERKALPAPVLTQLLTLGQGAVLGSLDGKKTQDALRFFQTPKWK